MHLFPGEQDFSVSFGFFPPGPTPITWLVLLTTRSRVQDWHSGHSKSTLSLELTKSFSNILPHSKHLNSKMGISLLLLFHTSVVRFESPVEFPKGISMGTLAKDLKMNGLPHGLNAIL